MAKLIDGIRLCGQSPGFHHINPAYGLPGKNLMTPLEGCSSVLTVAAGWR